MGKEKIILKDHPELWCRRCPECKQEIHYQKYSSFMAAKSQGSLCYPCGVRKNTKARRKEHPIKQSPERWQLACPMCHKVIQYNTYVTFSIARAKKRSCRKCGNKKAGESRCKPNGLMRNPECWERSCPMCGITLFYSSYGSWARARRLKCCCRDCNPGFRWGSGNDNPKWQGGTSTEHEILRGSKEYKRWRKAVFERDRYECCQCSSKTNIKAHHILAFAEYPDERFDIDNGLTLCEDCHDQIHNQTT